MTSNILREEEFSDAPSKTSPQTPADVLRAAADLIEPEGAWTQGHYWASPTLDSSDMEEPSKVPDDAFCFCALGAIARAADEEPDHACGHPAAEALKREVGPVHIWNDAPERTQAEVVAKLREVAAKLDETNRETALAFLSARGGAK